LATAFEETCWRASGPYLPTNASKAGLLDETRRFLLAYGRLRDLAATGVALLNGDLPQRSRQTRLTVLEIIKRRLVGWHPPAWVLDDLVTFADAGTDALRAALLVHVCRQDVLLYDVAQREIWPAWTEGRREVTRADVQGFLDGALATRPEIEGWSRETREKLAGNLLSILRDYGLLMGTARKRIVEPVVPQAVAEHLVRLLMAEGINSSEVAAHPDWRVWLWSPERVAAFLMAQRTVENH
jgi:hypothetical protein